MGYEKKTWKNRQSEYPNRRTLTPVDGQENTYDVARAEGLVMEEGDAFDQTRMNDLENRIASAFDTLKSVTVSLPVSGWTGEEAPYSQTVAVEGMTADRTFSAPTSGDNSQGVLAVSEALGLLCGAESAEGAVTVYATEKPEIDLSIILRG